MLKRVRADQVTLGMYLRRFEGSWLRHPFWRARFVVRTEKALARVRHAGLDVWIDASRGCDLPAPAAAPFAAASRMGVTRPRVERIEPLPSLPARPAARVVAPPTFGKADKARAAALAQRSTAVVRSLFDDRKLGRTIATGPILAVVDDIAATLEQNNRAFLSVTRLRAKDDAIYTHSVAVCALMIGLAREMGAAPAVVQALGTAGLLHDVGKNAINEALLHKAGPLSEADVAELRRHAELGHAMLAEEPDLPATARDVCLHHHERLDGSGYPHRLQGDAISQAARIAAISDVYDAMTSSGPSGEALSPVAAIEQMAADEGAFDRDLLFRFMRSIGIFPAGMLVRLRSNRLAVVLPQAGADRCPLARAFFSTTERGLVAQQDVVLSDRLSDDQAIAMADPAEWLDEEWAPLRDAVLVGRPIARQGRAARAA